MSIVIGYDGKINFDFLELWWWDAIWIKNYKTYKQSFNDLVEWWFIKEIEKSKNQYSSCIISIASAYPKNTKALDKALSKHSRKQVQSIVSIDIQETRNKKQETSSNKFDSLFQEFWNIYPNKKWKSKARIKYKKILSEWKVEHVEILRAVKLYISDCKSSDTFFKNWDTFLNQETYLDYEELLIDPFDMNEQQLLEYTKDYTSWIAVKNLVRDRYEEMTEEHKEMVRRVAEVALYRQENIY